MKEVHVRKRKDEVWRVRQLLTVPNWSVLKLLYDGIPRTNRQIYSSLGKSLTRKTLILSMRSLAGELAALEPRHTPGRAGFEIAYTLSPQMMELMKTLMGFDRFIARHSSERASRQKAP